MSNLSNLLVRFKKLSSLYTEEITTISPYFFVQKFFEGQVLMSKGDPGNYFAIILEGKVNIVKDEVIISNLSMGDLLGEMSLIYSEPRNANVVATSEGKIALMTFDDVESLRQAHPHIAVKLIKLLTEESLSKWKANQSQEEKIDYIALIADTSKKKEMADLLTKYEAFLSAYPLTSTKATANFVSQQLGVSLKKTFEFGRLVGNDQTLGSLIMSGSIQAFIYLRDPLALEVQQTELDALLRLCDCYQVPLATNLYTAEAVLYYLERA